MISGEATSADYEWAKQYVKRQYPFYTEEALPMFEIHRFAVLRAEIRADAYEEAYRAGQERMKQRAMKACEVMGCYCEFRVEDLSLELRPS